MSLDVLAPGRRSLAMADAVRLQRLAGNQAVVRMLAQQSTARVPPIQRAWTIKSVTRKTRLRADDNGRPNPGRKITATIAAGNAVQVNEDRIDGDWMKARRTTGTGVIEGWIRTTKLGAPTSLRERLAEGALRLRVSGHVPGAESGAQMRDFATKIHALPAAEYLAAYRRDSGKSQATQQDAGEGYFNPVTRHSYVVDTELAKGTVLHEMLHAVANPTFRRALGRIADEGATEFLRLKVQPPDGPAVHTNYEWAHRVMASLWTKAPDGTVEAIKRAYYDGDMSDFTALINTHADVGAVAHYRTQLKLASTTTAYEVFARLGETDQVRSMWYLLEGLP